MSPIARGFQDPVLEAQAVFRVALEAMSAPGRALEALEAQASLQPPAPLHPAAAALCLTLADFETPLYLDPAANAAPVREYLRFHCGAPLLDEPSRAAFSVIADPAAMPPLADFQLGSNEYPDRSGTIILQVAEIASDRGALLSGPGIETPRRLHVAPLPLDFWPQARRNQQLFPRGADFFFTDGSRLAALPRTTAIEE